MENYTILALTAGCYLLLLNRNKLKSENLSLKSKLSKSTDLFDELADLVFEKGGFHDENYKFEENENANSRTIESRWKEYYSLKKQHARVKKETV